MENAENKKLIAESEFARPDVFSEDPWESAYLRFETPEQEVTKFVRRLRKLGAGEWPRDTEIVELFCGRGNGLHALRQMGFTRVEGADFSARLLAQYQGDAKCHLCDCRQIPLSDRSRDVLIVQGGLHHLQLLPDDLARTLAQMHRVLRKDGRLVIVEPWLTPFLKFAHFVCEKPAARRLSNRLDALATMIRHERRTYEQWLNHPDLILELVRAHFIPIRESMFWGKWSFVGKPR
jgi:ubiquinone/menaquinone biosynthesis C-methylase UbiE